jgi:formylglycine-generating enzyme required for sulfatase activity
MSKKAAIQEVLKHFAKLRQAAADAGYWHNLYVQQIEAEYQGELARIKPEYDGEVSEAHARYENAVKEAHAKYEQNISDARARFELFSLIKLDTLQLVPLQTESILPPDGLSQAGQRARDELPRLTTALSNLWEEQEKWARRQKIVAEISIMVILIVIGVAVTMVKDYQDRRHMDATATQVQVNAEAAALATVTRVAQQGPRVLNDAYGVPMMYVPAGCIMMGSDTGASDEQPVHEVCLSAFWIDQTEVTNAQYGSSDSFSDNDRPQEAVTWFRADEFCKQRGARLPTEAEWEYAARGPAGWEYPWGNKFVANNVVYAGNSGGQSAEVGSRPGGASWVGALDMSGNVWEWVADWYGTYPSEQQTDPTGPEYGDARVLRGGSWNDSDPDALRTTTRRKLNPDHWYFFRGFRCARSAED